MCIQHGGGHHIHAYSPWRALACTTVWCFGLVQASWHPPRLRPHLCVTVYTLGVKWLCKGKCSVVGDLGRNQAMPHCRLLMGPSRRQMQGCRVQHSNAQDGCTTCQHCLLKLCFNSLVTHQPVRQSATVTNVYTGGLWDACSRYHCCWLKPSSSTHLCTM